MCHMHTLRHCTITIIPPFVRKASKSAVVVVLGRLVCNFLQHILVGMKAPTLTHVTHHALHSAVGLHSSQG